MIKTILYNILDLIWYSIVGIILSLIIFPMLYYIINRIESKKMNNTELANLNTGKDDWCTPIELFNELNKQYCFTLDPCSTHENALCKKHYTKIENGLEQDWSNDIVFCNPPYGRELPKWVKKAYEESQKGATVIMLIPARPDTQYWHNYIFPYANNIWFIKGRLHFSNSINAAGFPSCIIEFTSNGKGFENIVWK